LTKNLGASKGKVKLNAAIISGIFLSLLSIKVAKMEIPGIELAAAACIFGSQWVKSVVAILVALLPKMMSKKLRDAMGIKKEDAQ
jgi:hypothetical protein